MKSNKDDAKQSKHRDSTRMLLTAAKDTQGISLARRRCRCHPSMAKLSIVVLRALFSGYCAFGMITSWLAHVRVGKEHQNYSANCAGASHRGRASLLAQGKCAGTRKLKSL